LKNENSDRRRFIRKLAKIGATGGLAALLLTEKTLISPAQAADGGALLIGVDNAGTLRTKLTSSPSGQAAFDVFNSSSFNGSTAVWGDATAVSGDTYGVRGRSGSTSGTGVEGYAPGESGVGVEGRATSPFGSTYGVYGKSDSSSGVSVIGVAGNIGAKPIVAKGFSGQTANLQEWQNSVGTALSVVDKDGRLGVGTASPTARLHVQGPSMSVPQLRVYNPNNGSGLGQVAGIDLGTASGWRVWLRTRQNASWLELTGPSNIIRHRWYAGDYYPGGHILPMTDNAQDLGSGTKRWRLIRGVTITPGDLRFENNFTITEDQIGLAFKNDAGEKIAVLDREGNLHIKGQVIQDL